VPPIDNHYRLIRDPEDFKIEDHTPSVGSYLGTAQGLPGSDTSWEEKKARIAYYDQISEGYAQLYGEEQRGKYRTALDALDCSHADLVVDVGCGLGLFMAVVTGKVRHVVGVDTSKEMVKKAHCLNMENAHVVLCDADYLPFKGQTFDAAVAFTLLQNVDDPVTTIRQIASTLKPKSRAVLTALKKGGPREAFVKLIEDAGLHVSRVLDEENVKDFIAICQIAH